MVLFDNCGRPLLNFRIAVTQRCNYRCGYCHKEGEDCSRGECPDLKASEIVHLANIAVGLGISRVKLTGGEPLMRKDLCEIVAGIAAIPGLRDLSLTTNGSLLAFEAQRLHDCGLRRLNVSLPTLNDEIYHKLTDGRLENVLAGVEAAVKAGLSPVKLNMVVLSGINVDAVPEMMEFASKTGTILQLIELDPANVNNAYFATYHELLNSYEKILSEKAIGVETRRFMHNRRVYRLRDLTVEVVHPTENGEFCAHCARLRVTSDGKLKTCLMRNDNLVDVVTPMRNGAGDDELRSLFVRANGLREPFNKNA